MITANTRLTLPGESKSELIFRQTGAETVGALLAIEASYPPRGAFPPAHFHPEQDETFTIVAGVMTVRMAGTERRYAAGETFAVPRGAAHTMANTEETEARVLWEIRPALRTAEFYEALSRSGGAERAGGRGFGQLLRLAGLLREYRREMVLARPPRAVQGPLLALLAGLGKRIGGESDAEAGRPAYVVRERIVARCSTAAAFALLSDYDRDTAWRGGVVAMRLTTPGPVVVGSETAETIALLGKRITTNARIVAREAGRMIAFASLDGPVPVHGHRAVESTPDGALVTYYLAAEPTGLYRLFAPLLIGAMRRQARGDLHRLKALLEAEPKQKNAAKESASAGRATALAAVAARGGPGKPTRHAAYTLLTAPSGARTSPIRAIALASDSSEAA